MLNACKFQLHLSIQELLLWTHAIHDVLDLRVRVAGLLSVRVRRYDAPVKLEGLMQVLRRVVRRMRRRVLLASLCRSAVVSHIYSSDLPAGATLRPLQPSVTLTAFA